MASPSIQEDLRRMWLRIEEFLGLSTGGEAVTGTAGATTALFGDRTWKAAPTSSDLASSATELVGAGLVGFNWARLYVQNTTGWGVRTSSTAVNMLIYIPVAEWAAIFAYTSTLDVTPYVQTPITALGATSGTAFFPAGQWTLGTSLDIPSLVSVVGNGIDSTVFNYTPTTGPGFNLVGTSGSRRLKITLEKLSLYAATTSTGAGVDAAYFIDSLVSQVRVRNFNNAIQIENSWDTAFLLVLAESSAQDGFNVGLEANGLTFKNCSAFSNGRAGVFCRGARAVNFFGFNAEGNVYGAYIVAEAGYATASITFSGGYFEGNTTHEFLILSLDSGTTKPRGTVIRDVYFQPLTTNSVQAIRVRDADGISIEGVTFDNVSGYTYAYSVYMATSGTAEGVCISILKDTSVGGVYEDTGQVARYVLTNPILTANGAQWRLGNTSEEITLSTSGLTTDSTANLLPENSALLGVVARITTTITTTTDWALGDATTSGRFAAPNAILTAGTTTVGLVHVDQAGAAGPRQTAAAKLRITCTGANPGAGKIRATVFYQQFVAPAS